MKFLTGFAVFVLTAALSGMSSAAVVTVYDGITGATLTITSASPRTYMGQAFSIADPGMPVEITEMQINLVAAAAVNYQNSLIRVQFYGREKGTGVILIVGGHSTGDCIFQGCPTGRGECFAVTHSSKRPV